MFTRIWNGFDRKSRWQRCTIASEVTLATLHDRFSACLRNKDRWVQVSADLFTALELPNPSHNVPEVNKVIKSPDVEALKGSGSKQLQLMLDS